MESWRLWYNSMTRFIIVLPSPITSLSPLLKNMPFGLAYQCLKKNLSTALNSPLSHQPLRKLFISNLLTYQKASDFAKAKKTNTFESVLALLIYGLFLFPNMDNFIDLNAIKIFLTKNPVLTLLADTYHSIQKGWNYCLLCTSAIQMVCFKLTQIHLLQGKHRKSSLVSKDHASRPSRHCVGPYSH